MGASLASLITGWPRPSASKIGARWFALKSEGGERQGGVLERAQPVERAVVLSRDLAHYPVIDVLASVSRLVGEVVAPRCGRPATTFAS